MPAAHAAPWVDEYVEPVLIQGVDYVDWWDEAELRAILRAFARLPTAKAKAPHISASRSPPKR